MARLVRSFDWTSSTIGPPEAWPDALRAVVDLVLDCRLPMMIGLGPDLHLVYNDGYIPILGDKHPVLGARCEDAFGELWAFIGPILRGVYERGEAVRREDQLLPLDRRGFLEECYFTFSYSPLRDAEGEVIGLLSTAVETTDAVIGARRDALLQALAEAHPRGHPQEMVARACRALHGAKDLPFHLLWMPDDDGRLRLVSAAGADVTYEDPVEPGRLTDDGWPLEDPSTAGVRRVPVERLRGLHLEPSVRAAVTHAVVLPLTGGLEEVSASAPGVLVAGLAGDQPWNDAYRAFVERVGERIQRQYNTHRLRELLIAEAEDRYHQLFVQALDGIILGRPGGDILAANPAACRILGYSEAELTRGGRALVQDPDDRRWTDGLERRQATGEFTGELSWLHSSGRTVPCEVSSRMYHDASGELRSSVVLRDVTERRALQAQLSEAQKMEVVARVSGGIAHDFNNLLAIIDAQIDLLRDEIADRPHAVADLDLLAQTSRRAATLIRRLLEFTRRYQGEARAFNPSVALAEIAPLLRRLVSSGCELVLHVPDGLPDIVMAPEQFEQVVMNLVINARDAIDESGHGGTIEVTLDTHDDQVRLRVRDDGVGIEPSQLDRIFDAFHTTKAQGTGIGLSTVRLLVEEHGGRVHAESVVGEGSTFVVALPANEPGDATQPTPEVVPAEQRLDGARVVLVEDQGNLRAVLRRVLERAGAEVVVAANGEEGLRVARDVAPDVLVSDVVMPLLSGPELVRTLRAERPGLPVVLVSGYVGDEVLTAEMLDGVRFLHKPFASRELIAAVVTALGR